jgi:hypothetical protein
MERKGGNDGKAGSIRMRNLVGFERKMSRVRACIVK